MAGGSAAFTVLFSSFLVELWEERSSLDFLECLWLFLCRLDEGLRLRERGLRDGMVRQRNFQMNDLRRES